MLKKFIKFKLYILLTVSLLCFATPVYALDFTPPIFKNKAYKGMYIGQSISDPIVLQAGTTHEVTVKIKNVGTSNWLNSGSNYVSVYTVNPNYRNSQFSSTGWLSKNQPAKITGNTKPGEIGEFKIKLTAPSKAGDYREDFYLAAENLTWIESSYFNLKIKVVDQANSVNVKPAETVTINQSSGYKFNRDLKLGLSGEDVKELQKFLNSNGFYISLFGAGSVGNETLLFGSKTKDALARFQVANKISPAVGYFGPLTRNIINQKNVIMTGNVSASNLDSEGNSTQGVLDQAENVSNEFKANLLAFSARNISSIGGEVINFNVRYLNIGTVEWQKIIWQEAGSTRQGDILGDNSRFSIANSNWLSDKKIYETTVNIKPKEAFDLTYSFRAPAKKGEYIARFQLTADGHTLDGGTLEIPVSVIADAPLNYSEVVFSNSISGRQLIIEPTIRVGLYKTDKVVQIKSPFVYDVYSEGVLKGELAPNELAELKYNAGVYSLSSINLNFTSKDFIRLVPRQNGSYFILTNYERFVSWKGKDSFNAYRGVIEYKYSTKSNMPWVVNELPLDEYVAGIGETSNGAAMEYIKAILTAARSYAYFQINNGVPPDQRTYDVLATTADQLYLGYVSEVLMPRVVQAARSTYGEMVTYQGNPVITPYFANTDGKTKFWSVVWGGQDKPWLLPVECKYDVGKKLYGHGVGMSAADAAQRADKDDWTYEQLLKYYYTGVEVERIY